MYNNDTNHCQNGLVSYLFVQSLVLSVKLSRIVWNRPAKINALSTLFALKFLINGKIGILSKTG